MAIRETESFHGFSVQIYFIFFGRRGLTLAIVWRAGDSIDNISLTHENQKYRLAYFDLPNTTSFRVGIKSSGYLQIGFMSNICSCVVFFKYKDIIIIATIPAYGQPMSSDSVGFFFTNLYICTSQVCTFCHPLLKIVSSFFYFDQIYIPIPCRHFLAIPHRLDGFLVQGLG